MTNEYQITLSYFTAYQLVYSEFYCVEFYWGG